MECRIPPGYETFRIGEEEYTASKVGRGEIEIIDGKEVFVQYHGIMHTFEAERPPPRPVVEFGNLSGMCRSFMANDRREFVKKFTKEVADPVILDKSSNQKNFSFSRRNVQKAITEHLHLASLVETLTSSVTGVKIKRLVLVNPSRDILNIMHEQKVRDYNVLFRTDKREDENDTLYAGFMEYVERTRAELKAFNWIGKTMAADERSSQYFYYCGYNCEFWSDYSDSMTIELDPNAYVASGRKFDLIEEGSDRIVYETMVHSQGIQRCARGIYSKKNRLYRYTPDTLRKYFQETKDTSTWGMHGVLTTLRVKEWELYTHPSQVKVVTGASMLGARAAYTETAQEAQKLIIQANGSTCAERNAIYSLCPQLGVNSRIYSFNRYYIFDHVNIVLDTGKREYFLLDEEGDLEFMGSNYRHSKNAVAKPDLVLRLDSRGLMIYRDRAYMVVWHPSYDLRTRKYGYKYTMMPQTSIVHYVSGPAMFCQDTLFDETTEELILPFDEQEMENTEVN